MKLLALWDNALFVQNWRERTRPALVWSESIVCTIILFFIFTGTFISRNPWDKIDPGLECFWMIAVAQAILLLVVGTIAVNSRANRESSSGTLDFHRSSPTSRVDQVIGLTLGAPVLEWCIFLATLPISLFLTFTTTLDFKLVLNFYYSLILFALFLHLLVVFLGIHRYGSKASVAVQPFSPLKTLFVLYLFSPFLIMASVYGHLSFLYHATCLPMFSLLYEQIFQPTYQAFNIQQKEILSHFFGISLPPALFQLLVQLPFIYFLFIGIMRKISHPERPVLTKKQSLSAIAFLLFLFLGGFVSYMTYKRWGAGVYRYGEWKVDLLQGYAEFIFLSLFLGLVGVVGATPSQLLFLKGLRKIKKMAARSVGILDDYTSNRLWLAIFVFTIFVYHMFLRPWLATSFQADPLVLILLILYLVSFASGLEYFRLSRHHLKRSYLIVGILLLYFLLPIFGMILSPIFKSFENPILFCFSTSPFWGLGKALSLAHDPDKMLIGNETAFTWITVGVNLFLSVVLIFLAGRERRRLRRQVFEQEKI